MPATGCPGRSRRTSLGRPARAFLSRERAPASAHALPRRVEIPVEVHDQRVELVDEPARLHRPAADRDDAGLAPGGGVLNELCLDRAEGELALACEQLPDRAVRALDLAVDVVERAAEAARDLAAERGLASAHEPDQDEVPL